MADSTADTIDHINKVQVRIAEVQIILDDRAAAHDRSKLQEPEKTGYDRLTIALKDVVYGSDAYRAALDEAQETIAHHYAANSHHPEHYENGIAGMSLLDIIEMCCDWVAASERTKGGDPMQSLLINRERFGVSDQLFSILENTFLEMGWTKDDSR